MDLWLYDPAAPNKFLLSAPTARGKSALLVQWTERLESDATWAVVFVPISIRFGTDRPTVFYALLATQLASVLQVTLTLPSSNLDDYYQGTFVALMNKAAKEFRHVLIVVDALDEAQGAGFNPTVFPQGLPPHIKILVSARELAGDRGSDGWLRRLDWQSSGRAASASLPILDKKAVEPILESVGIAKEAVSEELIHRLMELSAGEPLLLQLYADDLRDIARRGVQVNVHALEHLSPGFSAYFSRAFDANLISHAGVDQEAVNITLAILAMAKGPVEGIHLTDLVCRLSGLPRPFALDHFVKPLKRFIAGDGRVDHGYVLNHPKLSEYLRDERLDATTRQSVEHAFIEWGRSVVKALGADPKSPAPTYILQYYVDHLSRAEVVSLDYVESILIDGWRQAWFRLEKDYAGYADSLLAASELIQPCASYQNEKCKALRLKIKIALLVGSVKSQGVNVPRELLGMGLQEGLITLRHAINIAKLQQSEGTTYFLLTLAPSLQAAELEKLLSDVLQTKDEGNRYDQLARLALYLPTPQRIEVIGDIVSWLRSVCAVQPQNGRIVEFAPVLDDMELGILATNAISNAQKVQDTASSVITLAPLIDILRERGMHSLADRLIHQCLLWIENSSDLSLAVLALGKLSQRIGTDRLELQIALREPMINARQAEFAMNSDTPLSMEAQFRRDRFMTVATIFSILKIDKLTEDKYTTSLMTILAPLFVSSFWVVDALLEVIPIIRSDARQEIVAIVHNLALNLPSANNRTHTLTKLASMAVQPLRKLIIEQALLNARCIDDAYPRGRALVSLFSTLPMADKEGELSELLGDIQNITYTLPLGELLVQLSNQLPAAAELAETGLQAMLMANDIHNSTVKVLNELWRFPPQRREAIFQLCWQRIVNRPDNIFGFRFYIVAHYAAEYWTAREFNVARGELVSSTLSTRVHGFISVLPVAMQLGEHDFIDETFEQIEAQNDSEIGLSCMIQAIKYLPPGDSRRNMLCKHWMLTANSDNPNVGLLINGYELLDPRDREIAWPKLVEQARATSEAGQMLARLSLVAESHREKNELLDAALAACAAAVTDQRIPQAAHIISICTTEDVRWRAFDLMTAAPVITRETVMSALQLVAPILAEVGTAILTKALMEDIRQSATWWP